MHWLNLFAKFSVTERTAGERLQASSGQTRLAAALTSLCPALFSSKNFVPVTVKNRVRVRVSSRVRVRV